MTKGRRYVHLVSIEISDSFRDFYTPAYSLKAPVAMLRSTTSHSGSAMQNR